MSSILFEIEDGVAYITLNRPDVFNSINREMALSLQEKLDVCASDESVRAVYLTGAGRAFCAGQDLKEVTDDFPPNFPKILGEHYHPVLERIKKLPKPVVCGINGVAAGAGANIGLACDITVATESASFIQAFSKIGLVPDSGGTWTLPRLIGKQKALALAMLGDKVGAKEAEQMGMIFKYFSDEEFEEKSKAIAKKLAKMPTKAFGYIKKAFELSSENDFFSQLEVEKKYQTLAGETEDFKEGVTAFVEKRKAVFKGK